MCLLIEEMVLSGFVIACLLAVSPTSLSPPFVKPTTDGVVLLPSAFAITVGSPPSSTATQLFVVPKSIPITLLIVYTSYCATATIDGRITFLFNIYPFCKTLVTVPLSAPSAASVMTAL